LVFPWVISNKKKKIYKTIILFCRGVMRGLSPYPNITKLRVSKNRVLRGIFGAKRKQQGAGLNCMRSPIICFLHQLLLG
jgi:ribosomal protein L15E